MHLAMADEGGSTKNNFWNTQPRIISYDFRDDFGNNVGEIEDKGKRALESRISSSLTILGCDMVSKEEAITGRKRSALKGDSGSNKKTSSRGDGRRDEKDGADESNHDANMRAERDRRKKMKDMFTTLHALLPHLPPKAYKSTIVEETISYIKSQEQTLKNLQKQKQERLNGMSNIVDPSKNAQQQKFPLLKMRDQSFMTDHHQGSSNNLLTTIPRSVPNARQFISNPTFQTWCSPNVVLGVCGENAHINICSSNKLGVLSKICYTLERHQLEVVSASVYGNGLRKMYAVHARGNSEELLREGHQIGDAFKQAAEEIILWVNS